MEADVMFMDCPAYLDQHGAVRCGLPAEVQDRYTVRSSDGPMESAKIRCPLGHWFNGPIESLALPRVDRQVPWQATAGGAPQQRERTASGTIAAHGRTPPAGQREAGDRRSA